MCISPVRTTDVTTLKERAGHNHPAHRTMTKPTLVNLTPHEINYRRADGTELVIPPPPKGQEARVEYTSGELVDVGDGIMVADPQVWGEIANLPPPAPGVLYVVSLILAGRAKRPDVVSPGTVPTTGRSDTPRGRRRGR